MTTSLNSNLHLIDQQNQVVTNFLLRKDSTQQQNFEELNQIINKRNLAKSDARNKGSYQAIVQQSLTTQDKPFLYEILLEQDITIIRNSLQKLSAKRVIQMLKMIKSLLDNHIKLGKGEDHCLSIALWLQWLVKLHLSTIVSNIENKQTITSIRKWLQKRLTQKPQLLQIKSHLLSQVCARQIQNVLVKKSYQQPKFDYIQEQKEQIQQSQHDAENFDQMDQLQMDAEMDQFFQDQEF